MLSIKNKNKKNRPIIISVVALIFVITVLVFWRKDTIIGWFNDSSTKQESNSTESKPTDSGSNTNSDKPSDNVNDKNSDGTPDTNDDQNNVSNDTIKNINVIINDASQYDSIVEIRSYAQGVVETDGTCTATFKKDGQTVTRTSAPLTNSNYTTCTTIDIPVSEFPSKGTWQLTVSYLSPKSKGSATTSVEVK